MPILRDVEKTFTFEDQRVEINELALDVYNLQLGDLQLTDFVVIHNTPSGTGTLTYNITGSYPNEVGEFNYIPPDLSSYLQTEVDPTVPHYVKSISQIQINNWDNAHSWGNHALVGYLTGISNFSINALVDVDTIGAVNGSVLKYNGSSWVVDVDIDTDTGILLTDLSVGSPATASGNGAIAYNNTNGVFTYTPPVLFSGDYNDLSNRPTPYSLPTASTTVLGGVKIDGNTINIDGNGVISGLSNYASVTTDDTAPTNPKDGDLWWRSDEGQLKVWYDDGDSQQWVDTGGNGVYGTGGTGTGIALGDLYAITAAAGTTSLVYDNVSGEFTYTPPDLSHTHSYALNDLSDVDTTGAVNGKIIKHNGTSWVIADDSGYNNSDLDAHINTSNAASGQILSWTGTDYDWISAATGNFSGTFTGNVDAGIVTSDSFVRNGGTSSQFLMADGSVSTSVSTTTSTIGNFSGTFIGNVDAGIVTSDSFVRNGGTSFEYLMADGSVSTTTSTIGNFSGTFTGNVDAGIVTSDSFVRNGGTSSQFLMADGSVSTSTTLNMSGNFSGTFTGNVDAGIVTSDSFVRNGGTSSQFLKADGSVDTSTYLTTIDLSGKNLNDLADVNAGSPTDGHVLKWDNGTSKWISASDQTATGGSGIALADLSITTATVGTAALTYNDTTGVFIYTPPDLSSYLTTADLSVTQNAVGTAALAYDNSTGVFSYTPPDLSGYITSLGWNYANVSSFPNVGASNLGSLGFAEDIGVLYYSNGNSWTNNRIVVTNDSNSSDFATLLGSYQRTYDLTLEDHTAGTTLQNAARKIVKLADNIGNVDEFVIADSNDITHAKTTNQWGKEEISFNTVGGNYSISSEVDAGPNDSLLRLTDATSGNTDEVKFAGADGLSVERTDEHTITFRNAPTATQYTDDLAKDAAFTAFSGGTHQNITFTYDSVNKVISANATGTGGGGGGVTYDLQGTNTTSNQAIVQLIPSTGTTDTIEFAGGDGTSVAWDGANKKVTITSNDYVVGANAAASGSGGLALVGSTFTYTPPDLSSYLTAIPVASTTVLGGVKQGANCTIQVDGTLDVVQGSYTLPTAGTGAGGTLGGVKVDGSTVTIDGNGVISSSGGTTVPQIGELAGTSSSIADNARGELSITGHKGYVLYKINVDVESWVRIYCDDTTRQADINRSEGNDPAPGSGVIAECRTSGANQDVLITPGIMGFNNDNPRTDTIYLSINNRSGSASAITVTLTALKIGE
jgi:hypothetical protein